MKHNDSQGMNGKKLIKKWNKSNDKGFTKLPRYHHRGRRSVSAVVGVHSLNFDCGCAWDRMHLRRFAQYP